MKIDLPITIIFDCQDHRAADYRMSRFIPHVCTLRFDSEDEDVPVELFVAYPPETAPGYPSSENGEGVLAILSSAEFRTLVGRARRSPYDYSVGTEQERTIAQEEADEFARQDGQFGAGA